MSDHGSGQGHPSPGWYPDPERPGNRRWWDGLAWTDFSEPLEGGGPTVGQPGPPQPRPGSGAAHGGYGHGAPGSSSPGAYRGLAPKIDPWLWQSIVVTLLCCLPLGIVGIVFASQAQTELGQGNHGEAQAKANQAKTFTLIGFWVGLAAILLSLFLVV